MLINVHAVRPFVATQAGQVSVHENSTIQLISGAHWYWWFVRVGDENAVEGFVPAELLELPNEKLARMNGIHNIQLSSAPLKGNKQKFKQSKKSVTFNDICYTVMYDENESICSDAFTLSPAGSDDTDSEGYVDILPDPKPESDPNDSYALKTKEHQVTIKEYDTGDLLQKLPIRTF